MSPIKNDLNEVKAISRSDMEALVGISEFKPVAPRSVQRLVRLGLVKKITGGAYAATNIGEELVKCYREALRLYKSVVRKRVKPPKEPRRTRVEVLRQRLAQP